MLFSPQAYGIKKQLNFWIIRKAPLIAGQSKNLWGTVTMSKPTYEELEKRLQALENEYDKHKKETEKFSEAQDKFKTLFDRTLHCIFICDFEGNFLDANAAALNLVGYSREELPSINFATLMDENQLPKAFAAIAKIKQFGFLQNFIEFKLKHKDGRHVWVETDSSLLFQNVNQHAILGVARDITDRKKAEKALRRNEERYALATRAAGVGVWDWNIQTNEFYLDPNLKALLGCSDKEIPNDLEVWSGYVYQDDKQAVMKAFQDHIDGKTPEFVYEHRMNHKDGSIRWILARGMVVRDAQGNPVRVVGTDTDITQRKCAEEGLRKAHDEMESRVEKRTAALSKSNERLKQEVLQRETVEAALRLDELRLEALVRLGQMTDSSTKEISDFVLDEAVKLTKSKLGFLGFMNDEESEAAIHVWSKEAMAQCSVQDKPIHYPIIAAGIWGEAARNRAPIIINDYSVSHPAKKGYPDGHVELLRMLSVPVFDQERIVMVAAMANKEQDYDTSDVRQLSLLLDGMWRIIQRKRAEEQLRQSKAKLQGVFNGILDPLILIGDDMKVKMLNKAAADYYEIADPQQAIGRHCHQAFKGKSDLCEQCRVATEISSNDSISYERKGLMDPDRFERVVLYPLTKTSGSPGDVIIRVSDITERRLFERQVIQKEKISSLGVLVSSIAHEINNPNNFVSFNIPILRDYIQEIMPIIDEYAERHAGLEFCRLPYPEFRQDIFKLLDNLEHGSGRISSFVSNLRDFTQDQDKQPRSWVELENVIDRVLSICHSNIKNAVNSFIKNVPEHLPKIYTYPYTLEQILMNLLMNAAQAADKKDSWIKLSATVNDGSPGHIVIEVSDNGCGIDEDKRQKIFDPFYTTKSRLDGTGLGLYVCHTLVEGLKGRIEVESQPGEGSIFKVILPATQNSRSSAPI